MKFSIENGFFIPGPSLTADKQGRGLKFSIENEISNREWNFQARMKISCVGEWFFMRSSENEFFRSWGPLGKAFTRFHFPKLPLPLPSWKFRGPRMGGWRRRGGVWVFWGTPIFRSRSQNPLKQALDWESGRPKNSKSNHDGSNPPFSAPWKMFFVRTKRSQFRSWRYSAPARLIYVLLSVTYRTALLRAARSPFASQRRALSGASPAQGQTGSRSLCAQEVTMGHKATSEVTIGDTPKGPRHTKTVYALSEFPWSSIPWCLGTNQGKQHKTPRIFYPSQPKKNPGK